MVLVGDLDAQHLLEIQEYLRSVVHQTEKLQDGQEKLGVGFDTLPNRKKKKAATTKTHEKRGKRMKTDYKETEKMNPHVKRKAPFFCQK